MTYIPDQVRNDSEESIFVLRKLLAVLQDSGL